MDLRLEGKTALVTGASMGIGKGIAQALAREGVDVAICARHKESLDTAAEEIRRESGRTVLAIPADLTKRADAEQFVAGPRAIGLEIDPRMRIRRADAQHLPGLHAAQQHLGLQHRQRAVEPAGIEDLIGNRGAGGRRRHDFHYISGARHRPP